MYRVLVCDCLSAADQSFQSLVIFFFLKRIQSEALLNAVSRLTSHITSSPDNDEGGDDTSESVFDMECQHMGTHVAGYASIPPSADEPNAAVHETQQTGERSSQQNNKHSLPEFGRRSIHDVKPTAGLQALHEYDGSDQDDEPENPLQSSDDHIEEIVVPIGFNSPVIKYVSHVYKLPRRFFSNQPAGLTRFTAAFWLSRKST